MVLMRKGDTVEYVPDAFIDAYKMDGFVIEGEETNPAYLTDDGTADKSDSSSESSKDTEKFICPTCGKEYTRKVNLDKHIAECHPDEPEGSHAGSEEE